MIAKKVAVFIDLTEEIKQSLRPALIAEGFKIIDDFVNSDFTLSSEDVVFLRPSFKELKVLTYIIEGVRRQVGYEVRINIIIEEEISTASRGIAGNVEFVQSSQINTS